MAAEAVQTALESAGCAGCEIILSIPSAFCLCAPSARMICRQRTGTRALLYRLEEKVPVSAEDVVADFVSTSDGTLGVCTLRAKLAPLIEALEGKRITVAIVCPASFLAMQHLLESENSSVCDDGQTEPYDAIVMAGR